LDEGEVDDDDEAGESAAVKFVDFVRSRTRAPDTAWCWRTASVEESSGPIVPKAQMTFCRVSELA
jgi:hypothetical protein